MSIDWLEVDLRYGVKNVPQTLSFLQIYNLSVPVDEAKGNTIENDNELDDADNFGSDLSPSSNSLNLEWERWKWK